MKQVTPQVTEASDALHAGIPAPWAYPPGDGAISPRRQAFDRIVSAAVDRAVEFVLQHWLLLANTANFLVLFGAVLVPYLRSIGWGWLATPLFASYRLICHQMPSRSYVLFGHQMAMCQRNVAIYTALLLTGLLYAYLRTRGIAPLSLRVYAVAITPMALDGFTQLFGFRESTWELRTLTGALFGVASVLLVYPYLDRAVARLALDPAPTSAQPVSPEP
jgi:uncharacterized membrane protein